jgi:hypothetical protein
MTADTTTEVNEGDVGLAQGDVGLLQTDVAKRLLASTLRARVAYVAQDGTPRVVPTWFHWTGGELVMPTYVRAPHVHRPAHRLAALRANPAVAITIDSEAEPPDVLLLRGRVTITEVDGVVPEYAIEARRRLPAEAADQLLAMVEQPGVTTMARVALRPRWVGVLDFQTRVPNVMAG